MSTLVSNVEQLSFSPHDVPAMPLPKNVLMVEPTHFSVDYVINPHMKAHVGSVDKQKARAEWNHIKELFAQIGVQPHVISGQQGLPDMVFCANQSLPYVNEAGEKQVIMSIMHADQRKQEVPFIEQWYRHAGYGIHHLPQEVTNFEGSGDALWHPGRRLLWGGHGFRTAKQAHHAVSDIANVPVLTLELVDDNFYHLDTCLCLLNETTALIYAPAFTEEGHTLLKAAFDTLIEAPEHEAMKQFACNAVCPDGKNVIIQRGATHVNNKLQDAGFTIHVVETNEFLKSGGSVFCMKQMVW